MPSPFAWLDLLSPDPTAARARVADVLGLRPMGPAGLGALGDDGGPWLGVQGLPDDAAPHALGQVIVDDVDAVCRRLAFVRGEVLLPTEDVPGYGRLALVATSRASVLALLQPEAPVPSGAAVAWSVLLSDDPKADATALRAVLGWTSTADGPGLVLRDGSGPFGEVIAAVPDLAPQWVHLVRVPDLAAAKRRAEAAGLTTALTLPEGRGYVLVDEDGLAVGVAGP